MAGVTAAVVGSAAVGAYSANKAASAQKSAANKAADTQQAAAAALREDLSPYTALGQQAINPLWAAMGYKSVSDPAKVADAQMAYDQYKAAMAANPQWDQNWANQELANFQQKIDDAKTGTQALDPNATLNQKFSFNADDLENTPGYQFALTQGLKSTNNSLAAQGLGLSGAQAKGLSEYATGLADQTYGNQYNRALSTFSTNQQQAQTNVGNLQNLLNVGQNSAAQTGQGTVNAANAAGNYQTQAGNATASGYAGVGNAVSSGINNYMLYNALYGK